MFVFGQKILTHISPKKTCRSKTSIWKDVKYHVSPELNSKLTRYHYVCGKIATILNNLLEIWGNMDIIQSWWKLKMTQPLL